ncbi:MAG: CocE/NonD family hydrolase [Candidatus Kapaibacterium sp.]
MIRVHASILAILLCAASSAVAFPSGRYIAIQIPTRDGKTLAADLYAIDTTTPRPTILVQTPYNKALYRLAGAIPSQAGGSPFPYDSIHYNYVVLDWRGFYASKAADVANYDRGLDGYDAVEWIATQGWNNGKVGTWGASALGQIQFMTAKHHPPHLICSVPLVKDFKTKYTDFYYGGEYRKEHVETLEALGFTPTSVILAHPTNDIVWTAAERATDYPDSIAIPCLMISGWYDHFPDDVIRAFNDLRTRGPVSVRNAHRLIMGPWLHGSVGKAQQGILSYPNAAGVSDSAALRFFDYYLRGIPNGYPDEPVVRYYRMGSDTWRATDDWYRLTAATDTTLFYLSPGGLLSPTIISKAPLADNITYNPRDPSPTIGGARLVPLGTKVLEGPQDLRDVVESRGDLLVYSTPALEQDLEVDGGVAVELYLSSDREDTDIGVRLCDVYPDGRSVLLTQGITRMRFRDGLRPADTSRIGVGQVYPVTVGLQNMAMTFVKGHRIRIDITSSNFPQYAANPNNGGPLYKPGDTLVAVNYVHHSGGTTLSRLMLPTLRPAGVAVNPASAAGYRLEPNAPNPFASSTSISFALPSAGHATLAIFDLAGARVADLFDGDLEAGEHAITWNADGFPAGGYICRLRAGGVTLNRPMMIVR